MENDVEISTATISKSLEEQQVYLENLINEQGTENIFTIKERMQEIMDDKVGIFRDGVNLADAVEELKELLQKSRNVKISSTKMHNNPELEEAYRVPKMLKLALLKKLI